MTSMASEGVRAFPATPGARSVRVSYVPILDVARGVTAGYQAQARYEADEDTDVRAVSPLELDLDGVATAQVIAIALSRIATLPPNTFLTVPVGAQVAATPAVRAAFAAQSSLAGVVLDLTGYAGGLAIGPLDHALADYRAAGALLAIGGHNAAQPELSSIVRFQPAFLRLGRDWIRGVAESESKRSAIEVIGQLAGQLDTWVLAEGIDSAAELRALAGLGVPLAQGEFVGPAQADYGVVAPAAAQAVPRGRPGTDGVLAPFVQPAYTARDAAAAAAVLPETSGFDLVVVVDDRQRPATLLERSPSGVWMSSPAMAVNVNTPVADVIARAMTRPRTFRFGPLACVDDTGRLLGVLPIEQLVHRLAR